MFKRFPGFPGTAPFTISKFSFVSTFIIFKFDTVVSLPPIRPAIFLPGKTRPGEVPCPIEPGAR